MDNRLSFKNQDGTWGFKTCDIKDFKGNMYGVACKLKDYEDTGLSPERVREVNEFYDSQLAKVLAELQEYQRLEEQGKLLKLHCKVEDTLYGITLNEIKEYKVFAINIGMTQHGNTCAVWTHNHRSASIAYELIDFGRTIFTSKEKAEQALKERIQHE